MNKSLLLFFFLFQSCLLNAQTENHTIHSIQFEGLKKTKATYLRQFLTQQEGDTFITTQLQNDVQQLWNVGTNHQITTRIDTLNNQQVNITFQLQEKKTLLPIVNFGGIKENIWAQLGAIDFNWLGRGHQFLVMYQNIDERHGGQIYYRIPYLNTRWGLAVDLLQFRSREPLFFPEGTVNYDYTNSNVGLTVIRNFGFRKRLELGGSFFVEKYNKSLTQFLEDPPGPDDLQLPKFGSKVEYVQDFLNYRDFYVEGWTWRSIFQTVYNVDDQSFFNSLILETRKFQRFSKNGNLALRARFGISTNNNTPFAPFVVDSRVNLRGSGNRIERGTAQAILNLEYRQTLFNQNRWAVQGVLFTDLGNWRSPGGELSELWSTNELRQFVGGGFRVIFKPIFNAVIRVDYGVDIYNREQRGLVLGIGQYF